MKIYTAIIDEDIESLQNLIDSEGIEMFYRVDNLGNNAAHMACLLNKPNILLLLHKNGFDLSKPCDLVSYGSPIFYAVQHRHVQLLNLFWELGYDIGKACDKYGNTPLYYAKLKKDDLMINTLTEICGRGSVHNVRASMIQALARGFLIRTSNKRLSLQPTLKKSET